MENKRKPSRETKELLRLSRKPITNRYHSAQEGTKGVQREAAAAYEFDNFLSSKKLIWLIKNLGCLGNTHYHPYPNYNNTGDSGIYPMKSFEGGDEIQIALLADWATDTKEADEISDRVENKNPDYTIHLGDTYYTGTSKEIELNFNERSFWHRGRCGSFALIGNHEMYSSGEAYYTQLLPMMGIGQYPNHLTQKQKASFMCLENEFWRVIGLDTGYYSLGGWLGIKSNTSLKLHSDQIDWLKNTVHPEQDKRGLIFLSHHQYCSAFKNLDTHDKVFVEDEFVNPALQLAKLIGTDRPVIWMWGHEHRMAVYGCYQIDGGIKSFGRCIGHGGMPSEILPDANVFRSDAARNKFAGERKLVLFDNRYRQTIDGAALGHNGYVMLRFNKEKLVAEYYDESDKILSEEWTIDLTTGKLNGKSITDFTMGTYPSTPEDNKTKLFHFTQNIEDAIRQPVNLPI